MHAMEYRTVFDAYKRYTRQIPVLDNFPFRLNCLHLFSDDVVNGAFLSRYIICDNPQKVTPRFNGYTC